MSTTKIEYQNKGFWIEKDFISILSHFICLSFENVGLNNFNSSLSKFYTFCDLNRRDGLYPNLPLESLILNNTDIQKLNSVLENAKPYILAFGSEISVSQLNNIEQEKFGESLMLIWTIPVKTASLITTIDIIKQLLDGTYPYTNQSYQYEGYGGVRPNEIII